LEVLPLRLCFGVHVHEWLQEATDLF
jgi:hypothetical protein